MNGICMCGQYHSTILSRKSTFCLELESLIVCLTMQVERMRERLQAYGVDCDALLADIVPEK